MDCRWAGAGKSENRRVRLGVHRKVAAQGRTASRAGVHAVANRCDCHSRLPGDLALTILNRPRWARGLIRVHRQNGTYRVGSGGAKGNTNRPVADWRRTNIHHLATAIKSPPQPSASRTWRPSPTEAAEKRPRATA